MPTALKVVVGFQLLGILADVYTVATGAGTTTVYARLAIGIALVAALLRGNESARAVVRFFAVIGVIGSVVMLLQGLQLGMGHALGMVALGTGALGLVANLYTFWALGRDDVHTWMATRVLTRIKP